ncbi:hypothetical protein PQX77_012321 [Marasmius sp. AFHP31]|nr:hypothetical protein PQX77_012321 [Marasmius sp. AFHP31]
MVVHVKGNQIVQRKEKERTEFDDYRNVKSGDFYRLEEICAVKRWRYNTDIYTVEVIGTEGRFTSMTYSGPDARRAFKEDFRKFSRARSSKSSAQVFAVDVGTVPSLLFWHGLLPISHFRTNLGWLCGLYVYNLRRKLNCKEEELWVDSGRGVFCQGPEGPWSEIWWMNEDLDVEELPLTAEMLQEDVFVRFLASLKSREADRLFLGAMWGDGVDDDLNLPEWCDQLTIFSTLTKSPITVANNVWTSGRVFTERQALENGLTRFRLEGDGSRLELWLNGDAGNAWLSQSSNIFQACGISLDDDLSVYEVIYSHAKLEGYLDDFPFPLKSQRRRQQPIYLFVYPVPPPPDIYYQKTSRLHFWSFHKDGQHRLSPESCLDFGLPIELEYMYSENWSQKTNNYKLIHQYQQLRGFDPTTTNFAQNLEYDDIIFQPIHHSDRFMEVSQEHSNSLDGSVTSDSAECLSDMTDQQLAEDPTSMTSIQGQITPREDRPTINSHCVTNKRQRRNMGYEGIARNDPEPDLRHKNDATNGHDPAMDGHNSRLVQPLPTRFRPFPHPVNSHPPIPLDYSHPPQGHQSQLHPPYHHSSQLPYPYPPCPAYPTLGDVPFASRVENMAFLTMSDLEFGHLQSRGWPELSQNSAVPTYFDALLALHAYDSAEISSSASDLTTALEVDYTSPSAYSGVNTITNAPRYELAAVQNTGWSGASQVETSAPVSMLYNGPAYPPASYFTPAVTYPSNSAVPVDFTYSSHSAVPTSHVHDPDHSSLFPPYGGGTLVPQQHWNPPVAHYNPPYNLPGFSFSRATYPSNSTVHAEAYLPLPVYAAQGHPSMLPSDGGDPLVPHQLWNTPADHTQQYTYEPSMQSTQPNSWDGASGEFGQGNGSSGWQ